MRRTELKIYSLVLTQSLSILSNAAQLNPSRWNIAISFCQDQLFVASRRSEHDLNDLCNTECWITKLLESAAERHPACYILIVWAGADTPSALPSRNPTPSAGHSGEASAGRAFSQIATPHSYAICLPRPLDAPHENKWTLTFVATARMRATLLEATIHCRKLGLLWLLDHHFLRGWIQTSVHLWLDSTKIGGKKRKVNHTLCTSDVQWCKAFRVCCGI